MARQHQGVKHAPVEEVLDFSSLVARTSLDQHEARSPRQADKFSSCAASACSYTASPVGKENNYNTKNPRTKQVPMDMCASGFSLCGDRHQGTVEVSITHR